MPPPRPHLRNPLALHPSSTHHPRLPRSSLRKPTPSLQSTRPLTTTPTQKASHSQYDPPSGWLWGVPPGQKPEKEGWENMWFYGFWGAVGITACAYVFKPDSSIQTWALEEARRRLESEGILTEPIEVVKK
ncbi:MAG: hypothetical protein M1814_001258 [Vezdaea aestivalis]|nr:MAG: hypothetical protein M1814_001258 [Vezdaea aestivalis]